MMNKKYMDFVPVKATVKTSVKETAVKKSVMVGKTAKGSVSKGPDAKVMKSTGTKTVKKPEVVREELVIREDRLEVGAETFSLKKEPKYGVIEDFRPKFVKTEVKKRPLSRGHFATQKSELAEAKAVKVTARKVGGSSEIVEKPVEKSGTLGDEASEKAKMKIPKSPFINQAKVTKRPLSKNIYERTVKPTEEVPTGPVTIISKPEKDAKVGRVVAIILAIILGAAAGTVAFLLLPK